MSGCNCGSSCGCGSDCKCGKKYPDLGISEENTTVSVIAGFAPTKTYFEEAEMSYGAENGGCKCGSDCQCGSSCACGK